MADFRQDQLRTQQRGSDGLQQDHDLPAIRHPIGGIRAAHLAVTAPGRRVYGWQVAAEDIQGGKSLRKTAQQECAV